MPQRRSVMRHRYASLTTTTARAPRPASAVVRSQQLPQRAAARVKLYGSFGTPPWVIAKRCRRRRCRPCMPGGRARCDAPTSPTTSARRSRPCCRAAGEVAVAADTGNAVAALASRCGPTRSSGRCSGPPPSRTGAPPCRSRSGSSPSGSGQAVGDADRVVVWGERGEVARGGAGDAAGRGDAGRASWCRRRRCRAATGRLAASAARRSLVPLACSGRGYRRERLRHGLLGDVLDIDCC